MITDLLNKNKTAIIKNWTRSVLETYPVETSKFLELKKDRFSNPVGFTISSTAECIYDEIISGSDFGKIKLLLNDIIKIRAIQNFSPSSAIGFIFSLKKVIRDELGAELSEKKNVDEFSKLESAIDRIALIAFDLYMEAREKVFKIRVNEIKAGSFSVNTPVNKS
jgi:hypothetical protein